MSKRFLGAIGVLWGGGILLSALLNGGVKGVSGYAAGQMTGLVFGLLLFCAGVYHLVKNPSKSPK